MPGSESRQLLSLDVAVPSPSRRTREGEASTKPESVGSVGFVAPARLLGGQLFIAAIIQIESLPKNSKG